MFNIYHTQTNHIPAKFENTFCMWVRVQFHGKMLSCTFMKIPCGILLSEYNWFTWHWPTLTCIVPPVVDHILNPSPAHSREWFHTRGGHRLNGIPWACSPQGNSQSLHSRWCEIIKEFFYATLVSINLFQAQILNPMLKVGHDFDKFTDLVTSPA